MFNTRRFLPLLMVLAASLLVVPAVWGQEMTPSVTVSDQAIEDGTVTIDTVVSDGPGWIVIHIQEDGAPGAIIGQAPVSDGENTDVEVEIDVSQATETLYAMLHEDTGEEGMYDFPDGDPPVEVDGEVVLTSFMLTGGLRASVTVSDQAIEDGMVTVATVVSDGPGWIVIHADEDGSPGPVIGQAQVSDGTNDDVSVEIDAGMATETLYAMLHEDTGEEGTYEFPDGDPPVQVEGSVVVEPFTVTGGMEEDEEATETPTGEEATETPTDEGAMLPETGAGAVSAMALMLMIGGVIALAAGILIRRLHGQRVRIDDRDRS
jgi:hypothetical protein